VLFVFVLDKKCGKIRIYLLPFLVFPVLKQVCVVFLPNAKQLVFYDYFSTIKALSTQYGNLRYVLLPNYFRQRVSLFVGAFFDLEHLKKRGITYPRHNSLSHISADYL